MLSRSCLLLFKETGCSCYSNVQSASIALFVLLLSISLNPVFPVDERSENFRLDAFKLKSSFEPGWRLPDAVATVNRLFEYHLPQRDDNGFFTNYKVLLVSGKENLPPWLYFNKVTVIFEGVPGREMIGEENVIEVIANYRLSDGNLIPFKEYFTIKVANDNGITTAVGNDLMNNHESVRKIYELPDKEIHSVRCRADAAVTTATVVMDADEKQLSAEDRVFLLRNTCSHLHLPATLVRLVPLDKRPIFDAGALVAGPGDTKNPSYEGIMVQWDVGCGNVFAEHMPILELLEVTSNNGTMRKVVGHGIIGWHITSKKTQKSPTRLKRQLYYNNPTATIMPSVIRPTGKPIPTMVVTETTTETRLTMTTTTTTEETKTKDIITPEPTLVPKESSKVRPTKSPVPSRVTVPPTRVVDGTITIATGVTDDITPSWSVDVIEPSVISQTSATTSATELLPAPTTMTATTTAPKITRRPPKTPKPTKPIHEAPPNVNRGIDVIHAIVGNLLLFKIPNDTFVDREDGSTENLKLIFMDAEENTVSPSSWIHMNMENQTLYGLPMDHDIGTHRYLLAAANSHNKLAKTPVNISVDLHSAFDMTNHEFSLTLDLVYHTVMLNVTTRIILVNTIAAAFGDKDASQMTVTKIAEGSVEISWTNNTIPFEPCPKREIQALLKYFLLPNGMINETFEKAMEPYLIIKAGAKQLGSCASVEDFMPKPSHDEITTTTTVATKIEVRPVKQDDGKLLLYILIPLLIFVFLLFIVIVVCCVACHKKQKRRQKEEKVNGLHKGIPIIFADELEDKQSETPASTLKGSIRQDIDEDQQSVPPPEYPRSKPGSKSSTLRSDYKAPLIASDDEAAEEEERRLQRRQQPIKIQSNAREDEEEDQRLLTTPY